MRRLITSLAVLAVLVGCAAPYDDDGEVATRLPPAADKSGPTMSVVVDTDLGADDLVALAFLLRHPAVQVEAITIAATGLVGCDAGADVAAGLLDALGESVPVACGRETGARELPASWRDAAERGSGIPPRPSELVAEPAAELIGALARREDSLTVVALGPLTNLADLLRESPRAYRRVAGVHAMGGSVDGPLVDGVAEWNAAADPAAFAAVLEGAVPVTVVPEDAVPDGTPEALDAPVVGAVAAAAGLPKWWDLATAAALVVPEAGEAEEAPWSLDPSEPGRLVASGAGSVRVYRSLDASQLEAQYAKAFTGD